MIVPRLGNQADAVGGGLQNGLKARIVRHRAAGALGHTECREACRLQIGSRREKLAIRRIGARIAALDVVEAKLVEHAQKPPLVLQRKVDARRLRAVAQRRVEQVKAFFAHECFARGAGFSLLSASRFIMVVLESH